MKHELSFAWAVTVKNGIEHCCRKIYRFLCFFSRDHCNFFYEMIICVNNFKISETEPSHKNNFYSNNSNRRVIVTTGTKNKDIWDL